MGKTAISITFCFYPFPLSTMLRSNEQKLRQAMLWVRNTVWGGGGGRHFKHSFENSHNILSLIVAFLSDFQEILVIALE